MACALANGMNNEQVSSDHMPITDAAITGALVSGNIQCSDTHLLYYTFAVLLLALELVTHVQMLTTLVKGVDLQITSKDRPFNSKSFSMASP